MTLLGHQRVQRPHDSANALPDDGLLLRPNCRHQPTFEFVRMEPQKRLSQHVLPASAMLRRATWQKKCRHGIDCQVRRDQCPVMGSHRPRYVIKADVGILVVELEQRCPPVLISRTCIGLGIPFAILLGN